ncbi:SDR family oxidoreductase [Streptomyces camponoticapitis]|nr:SDR family oxidoreductase [Streptomyces camponoticapitis]
MTPNPTGPSASGVGFAVAEAAADENASVVVASRRRDGVGRAVAALPAGAEGRTVDVTDENGVRALFDELGAFDHLVYTAAEPLLSSALADTEIDVVRRFFELRHFGALTAVKYGAPHIRPGGSVGLVGGTAAGRPEPGTTAVSSVLAAMEGPARALAVELSPLRVNVVVPGILRSQMWSGLPQAAREAMYQALEDTLLVGPRVGEPTDVADAFVFLMRNRHMTGSTLTIDGGQTLT